VRSIKKITPKFCNEPVAQYIFSQWFRLKNNTTKHKKDKVPHFSLKYFVKIINEPIQNKLPITINLVKFNFPVSLN
jgi:hypothetical protein